MARPFPNRCVELNLGVTTPLSFILPPTLYLSPPHTPPYTPPLCHPPPPIAVTSHLCHLSTATLSPLPFLPLSSLLLLSHTLFLPLLSFLFFLSLFLPFMLLQLLSRLGLLTPYSLLPSLPLLLLTPSSLAVTPLLTPSFHSFVQSPFPYSSASSPCTPAV